MQNLLYKYNLVQSDYSVYIKSKRMSFGLTQVKSLYPDIKIFFYKDYYVFQSKIISIHTLFNMCKPYKKCWVVQVFSQEFTQIKYK